MIDAIKATQYWLQKVVIGENFCPFAKREYERQRIRFVTAQTDRLSTLLALLIKEYELLDKDPNGDTIETTLLILTPAGKTQSHDVSQHLDAQSFDDFLLIIEETNWQLEKLGYDGVYQLASFHPDYLFAGEPTDSASHYTNRSPFPILHIIRETSIDRALKTFKQPESIPEVNIQRANHLGIHYLQNQLVKAIANGTES